jgi:hypothetical protein
MFTSGVLAPKVYGDQDNPVAPCRISPVRAMSPAKPKYSFCRQWLEYLTRFPTDGNGDTEEQTGKGRSGQVGGKTGSLG